MCSKRRVPHTLRPRQHQARGVDEKAKPLMRRLADTEESACENFLLKPTPARATRASVLHVA